MPAGFGTAGQSIVGMRGVSPAVTERPTPPNRRRLAAGLLATILLTLMVLASGSVQAATVTVSAHDYAFTPNELTVSVGDAVRWTFSGEPHTVTSRDGLFDSGITDPGGSFQFRFTRPGTYRYYCQVHPEQMSGTIVVRAGAATPRPTASPAATARATAKPTVRPTVKPASTPAPAPTAAPTTAPGSGRPSQPAASAKPSESGGASVALLETPDSTGAGVSAGPGSGSPAGTTDTAPVVTLAVIALGVLVVGLLLVARRRRPV